MTAAARVSEIEEKLCAVHQDDPNLALLVMQVCAIAKTALASAEERWQRHDKRHGSPSGSAKRA